MRPFLDACQPDPPGYSSLGQAWDYRAMLRYFFHLRRDGSLIEDLEGGEYESLQEARAGATRCLREMLAADVKDGIVDFSPQILVSDGEGVVKGIVHLAEGLTLRGVEADCWNPALSQPAPRLAPS
jgi:hypothetical protein